MPTNEELRSIQKRVLVMLIKAKRHPERLDELIEEYSLEMQDEDVSHVKQKLGHP